MCTTFSVALGLSVLANVWFVHRLSITEEASLRNAESYVNLSRLISLQLDSLGRAAPKGHLIQNADGTFAYAVEESLKPALPKEN
jgi:hypothetical protein